MSQYLSHLAALTLNRAEPLLPRLASRFETPLDAYPSDNNSVEASEAFQVAPPAPAQPFTASAADRPVEQNIAPKPVNFQIGKEIIEPGPPNTAKHIEIIAKRDEPPKPSPIQVIAVFDTPAGSAVAPVIPTAVPPTEHLHTLVERMQERFTETTHREQVIREAATPSASQKTDQPEKKSPPAPVKPARIVVRTEQAATGRSPPRQNGKPLPSETQVTPMPTVQVSIGRIEIRASQASVKPATKPRTADTAMSLDDYLKQRNGGRA